MNLKLQVILFLNLVTSVIFAQKGGFDASVFLGFNGIHIEGDNEVLYNSSNGTIYGNAGINAGLAVKKGFAKNLYWSFDLRYIRKGSIYVFTNTQGVRDFETIKLHYAELPVMLGFKTNINKKYLYFEIGTAIAKLLNSKKIISDYTYGQDISLFNQFKDYDYSVLGALKISANRKEKLIIGLRVSRSFLSIHKVYKLYNFDYGIEFSYYI